jgi:hypothetical protein
MEGVIRALTCTANMNQATTNRRWEGDITEKAMEVESPPLNGRK